MNLSVKTSCIDIGGYRQWVLELENETSFYEIILDVDAYRRLLAVGMPTPQIIVLDASRMRHPTSLDVVDCRLVMNTMHCHGRVKLHEDTVKKIIEELTRVVAMTNPSTSIDMPVSDLAESDHSPWDDMLSPVRFSTPPRAVHGESQPETPPFGSSPLTRG